MEGSGEGESTHEHVYRMCVYRHTYENETKIPRFTLGYPYKQSPLSSVPRIISHLSGWVDKLPGSTA